ncbi:MAG TPA: transporter [Hyphomicrobiaceae bacterium]|nr:transporter [Hyphomicrobiaceae bacterium]
MNAALRMSTLIALAATQALPSPAAYAAESATSVYLLGSKGAMAGFTPPPGTYIIDANYYYSGSAGGTAAQGIVLPKTRAEITATINVEGQAYYNIPTVVWVAPSPVLGGNFGFSLMTPIGYKGVEADMTAQATVTLPPPIGTLSAGRSLRLEDDRTAFGDPLASAFIGWHSGNWHYNITAMANIPLGQWDTSQLANIGFNHWAFDFTGAVTWLDPKVGFELSAALGITFNTENPDTNYKSGTDFHVEFAALQHLSKQFSIGLAGYHYQQLTGDSGTGAVLGDFKGRVTGIGPAMTYNFQVGQVPVMTSVKWTHEFNTENRLKGDMGLLTVAIPLGPPPPAPSMK